ncbi:NAD(P)/FAD-dependent oxidoreductase [Phaeobacter gallaeciensis]|uniref:Gamma-glutamylputrescine oxidoreductase PuuB n=1 Tax=Phaeobacter gallaeciensis TaxID=60890 RepID=A0AAC9Z9C6_9RHOB|nr:FAD-binding oxidoreductase [Phaeobacter gallaeciensis]AHD10083.1 gamma-glutamylputrescine oxidase [Phaeobacter gallaeciensis DSM 26640]ATE93347.1 gamma-glutamylputrescine oxidoreductase PuuB [Phaeobacter gallaeciensis]ATE96832.1 gamma-glutamylputrescine oxidoreductase PuuB [Phaeobacter gallaeciensis]ATF02011.1 gamma-glutamylputrescine oxidoreductase PuuB [Phaeobacter gallaeciensis]ATF06391.1 gamma-glutamylputrescine oxidoreductase PuuB [Phaeobacter gallaeciensis]
MGLNLLYSNDQKGTYPNSWYAATATPLAPFAPLQGEARADVCVVGGGYTGLSAALHLAEAGRSVILLEANRVGFGASGRNGGQLGSGQRMEQDGLEKLMGDGDAAKLWTLAQEAKDLVKSLITRHDINCHLKPGIAHACFSKGEVDDEHRYVAHLQDRYGYGEIEALDHAGLQAVCPSPAYVGGSLDMGAAHLHPLAYALGLARAAAAAGVRICEGSEVLDIEDGTQIRLRTAEGQVTADQLVLACNGYLGGLNRQVATRVMPINNFIAATEPLGADAARVLARDVAVADSKFVVNYFRLSHDGRLLFGGGESYGYRFPSDIAATVRKPMTEIFPHLRDVKIDYAWGGTLAITMKRMPYLARLAPNVLSASGYSGHGVGTATHAGQLMARAIAGDSDGFDTMSRVPAPAFPGGAAMRSPLLALAMTWYSLRDRLGI